MVHASVGHTGSELTSYGLESCSIIGKTPICHVVTQLKEFLEPVTYPSVTGDARERLAAC